MPVVSVVIPTYNRPQLVKRAIDSVLQQTYQDFEIVVVDDGSGDETPQIVQRINDSRVRLIHHERNKGAAAARNTGIKAALGQYIALLDSDDEWMPEKLEKQVEAFKSCRDSVGVIYCGRHTISEKTGLIIKTHLPILKGNVHKHALRFCIVGCGSLPLIKRQCFQKVGYFDENIQLQSLEDWDLWIRIAKEYEFDFVADVLVKRYIHGEQLTAGMLKQKLQARAAILKKHHHELSRYPSIVADHLNRLGILHCLDGAFGEARTCFLKSITIRPWQRFAYIPLMRLLLRPGLYRRFLENEIIRKSIDDIALYW